MNLVYDSETFSVEDSFAFLQGLNLHRQDDKTKNGGSDNDGNSDKDGEL